MFFTIPHKGIEQSNIDINKDSIGREKPQRIVSLSPGNTEILFALSAGDRVVGVASYSDYPEDAKNKPSIGGYHAPDVEKILSLAPDLVIAMGEVQVKYIQSLKRAGIVVVSVEPKNMQEILDAIDIISAAIGEQERGVALRSELEHKLSEVRRVTANSTSKRVFLEVWDSPLLTVGNKSFINDIINQAGGINVAAERNVDYTPCDIETLYSYDPDAYVVISHSRNASRAFINKADFADMAAVKNQQIAAINDDLLTRPGPRSFTGLVKLAEILHPEAIKDGEIK